MALLADLHRVDAAVLVLVAVLGDGCPKRLVQQTDAIGQDVREPQQQRQVVATLLDVGDQVEQVDLVLARARGVDLDVAALIDLEVGLAPPVDVVQLLAVFDAPLRDRLHLFNRQSTVPPR
ncbi:hypothetical protein D3C72_1251070 [compost metagenome]